MSVIKDAIAAMKEVMSLSDKVDRAGNLLTDISRELRDHDNRLVRLETLVEVAQSRSRLPPADGE